MSNKVHNTGKRKTITRHYIEILSACMLIVLVLSIMLVQKDRRAYQSDAENTASTILDNATANYYSYLISIMLRGDRSALEKYLNQVRIEENLTSVIFLEPGPHTEGFLNNCHLETSSFNGVGSIPSCHYLKGKHLYVVQQFTSGSRTIGYLIKSREFVLMSLAGYAVRRPLLLGWLLFVLVFGLYYMKELHAHLVRPLTCLSRNARKLEVDYMQDYKLHEVNNLAHSLAEAHREIISKSRMAVVGRLTSYIAHDMRSPLSVLKTYAGLKTAGSEDPDVENLRQSAERSVGKLERMAEDLVDYAKASKLQKAQHRLSGVIYEGSIAEARKQAEERGIKISSAIQGGIFVNVDAYKLERVITNLVNNAVQAIAGPGEVSIAATTEHNGVLKITVKDNGKGIDPEALPHIFDSFFTRGKKGGSGLGLAYCKQVIEAHGGTIDAESELGKGSTFTIRIPDCAVAKSADALVAEANLNDNARDSSTPLGMTGKSILIADDDPEIRKQWHRIIPERGGTIVHTAKTVKEVEEGEIDYSKIDAAIVDYQFYGEDKTGIDLIKHLKAKGVKTVYLCTGFYDNEVIIKQAQAAGVERVLPKPIDVRCLS